MKKSILLGSRKGLIVFSQSNEKWRFESEHFPGIPVSYAFEDSKSGTWWACLDHGHWGCKLHYSKNRGKKWTEVEAPKYPENEMVKKDVPAALRYIWSAESLSTGKRTKLFLGTDPGGLFYSEDSGNSFHLVRGLWDHPSRKEQWFGGGRDQPGIHSILIDPDDNEHMYVGISCAGVFESVDGGISWNPRNKGLNATFLPDPNAEVGHDPHLLTWCKENPKVMWQQNHCGIFRSSDAGENWNDISQKDGPANFGFAILADSKNENKAWVIPAISDEIRTSVDKALCVCVTEDAGMTWKKITKGLPQENCYDIVYRHSFDGNDEVLAFGTTTGNLFISEDSGETWDCLHNYLPMVYSLRFAR